MTSVTEGVLRGGGKAAPENLSMLLRFYMTTSAPEQNQQYAPSIQQLLETVSLYLHIPFCHTRCYYCDFNTYAGILPLREPYVRALLGEIALAGEQAQHADGSLRQARTIFFGRRHAQFADGCASSTFAECLSRRLRA